MNPIQLKTNFALFLLFFGMAFLDAIQDQNWLKVLFWLAIGFVFLVADNQKPTQEERSKP